MDLLDFTVSFVVVLCASISARLVDYKSLEGADYFDTSVYLWHLGKSLTQGQSRKKERPNFTQSKVTHGWLTFKNRAGYSGTKIL